MAIEKIDVKRYKTETEWLEARTSYIGGSDAACIIGFNPWKSNIELWREKTGRKQPDDISDNEAVKFGKEAEEHLRELFALDYRAAGYLVLYEPLNMWTNTKYPWAHASLDGWILDESGNFEKRGILEIKTATINSASQARKWQNGIPDNYFVQILHYLAVTGSDFAILSAYLRYEIEGEEIEARIRRYRLERDAEVQKQIDYLMEKERLFSEHIKNDTEPPLVLNI